MIGGWKDAPENSKASPQVQLGCLHRAKSQAGLTLFIYDTVRFK